MTPFTMKHFINFGLVLTLGLLFQQPNGVFGFYVNRPEFRAATQPAMSPRTTFLDDEITYSDPYYDNERLTADLKHYYRSRQSNYMTMWPGLRDLFLMPANNDAIEKNTYDYNDQIVADAPNNEKIFNVRFMKNLKFLSENNPIVEESKRENGPITPEIEPEGTKLNNDKGTTIEVPVDLNTKKFKEQGKKKNVPWPFENIIVRKAVRKQYMSPCHFKICNMGRKRHARY